MIFKEYFSGWNSITLKDGEILYFRRKQAILFYAVLYIVLLTLIRHFLVKLPLLFLLLCIGLFFALHVFFLLYCSVINQTRNLLTYRSGGNMAWLFSRRWLLFLIDVVIAIVLSFLCVVRLIKMPLVDFCIMGVTLLFMAAAYGIITRWMVSESIPFLVYQRVMRWSLPGALLVTFFLQVGGAFLGSYDFPLYADIQEALDARIFVADSGSNIINHLLNASSFLQTCEMYFISQALGGNIFYYVAMAFFSVFSVCTLLTIFSLVVLPPSEWRRIFVSRCIASTSVPSCDRKNIFWFSVIGTLIFLALAFGFANMDERVGNCFC